MLLLRILTSYTHKLVGWVEADVLAGEREEHRRLDALLNALDVELPKQSTSD